MFGDTKGFLENNTSLEEIKNVLSSNLNVDVTIEGKYLCFIDATRKEGLFSHQTAALTVTIQEDCPNKHNIEISMCDNSGSSRKIIGAIVKKLGGYYVYNDCDCVDTNNNTIFGNYIVKH